MTEVRAAGGDSVVRTVNRYARERIIFGAVLVALSGVVGAGVWERSAWVWVLGLPGGVLSIMLGVYFHRVGKRGGWSLTESE